MANPKKTVLIAVDGSDHDRLVISKVLDLFGQDTHYVVVNVDDQPTMLGAMSMAYGMAAVVPVIDLSSYSEGLEEQAEEARETATHAAEAAGLIDVDTVGEVGDPASILLSSAEEHQADVIAVGTGHRSWISRLFEPSVAEAVIHRATCAVLVVHADPEATT